MPPHNVRAMSQFRWLAPDLKIIADYCCGNRPTIMGGTVPSCQDAGMF